MKPVLITLTLLASIYLVSAQEKLSRDEALGFARAVGADLKQLKDTPIPTDVDTNQPVAMREYEYGGLVLPQKGLTSEAITKAGETPVPVGQIWFHKLAPMKDGGVVSESALRVAKVDIDGQTLNAPQCALAVRKAKTGDLELLVYGKAKEPVLTVPLKSIDTKQTVPIDLEAENQVDSGRVTLKILGKHQATFSVTELEIF